MFVVGGANTLNSKSIVLVSKGFKSEKSKVKMFDVSDVAVSLAFKKFIFEQTSHKRNEKITQKKC